MNPTTSRFNKRGSVSTGLLIGGAILAVAFLFIAIVVGWGFSTYNDQARLRNLVTAKTTANKADLDNVKQSIGQSAQVTEAQMDKLQELFTSYAASRSPKDAGKLMLWVKETVPNVDTSTFNNLMNIINSKRDSWASRQKELTDVVMRYNNNLDVQPKGWFLGVCGFQRQKDIVITTSAVQRAFETGIDEPDQLFTKKGTKS